jgi:S-adenosyl methyltransferase
MYDYALGGKDNFITDREAAEEILKIDPGAFEAARQNRDFLRRAVRFAAGEGATQFIDIGAGLPTVTNTHEVVQSVHPSGRVFYLDNDPVVLPHARALLATSQDVRAAFGDLAEPASILRCDELTSGFIDFSGPSAWSSSPSSTSSTTPVPTRPSASSPRPCPPAAGSSSPTPPTTPPPNNRPP